MREGLSGIILAGGNSRRMGRDKAFLPWGGATLLAHVIETLRPVVDELLVVVADAKCQTLRKAGISQKVSDTFSVRVVEDVVPNAHALGGLYTGLRAAAHELCFVCACDAPFLNVPLIRFLVEQADGYELVIPKTRQGLESLHAIYAKTALGAIRQQLDHRQWDLKALASKVRTRVVASDLLHRFDPEGLSCFNINAPEDLAQALLIQQHVMRSSLPPAHRWVSHVPRSFKENGEEHQEVKHD